MSQDSLPVPSWDVLREALAEWRGGIELNEAFMLRQCDYFDAWRAELLEVEARLQQQTEALETDREAIKLQWSRLDELRRVAMLKLQQVQSESRQLTEARQKTTRGGNEPPTKSKSAETHERAAALAESEQQRQKLERQLAAAYEQLVRVAPMLAELNDTRRELADARQQALRMQQRLAHAKGHFALDHETSERLQQELAAARSALVETQRTLNDERQQFAQERTLWATEWQQLRIAVESQSLLLSSAQPRPSVELNDVDTLLNQLNALQSEVNSSPRKNHKQRGRTPLGRTTDSKTSER